MGKARSPEVYVNNSISDTRTEGHTSDNYTYHTEHTYVLHDHIPSLLLVCKIDVEISSPSLPKVALVE